MLGEVADVVATGQRVLPQRALAMGYSFRYPNLDGALANLLP
jgi:NAD dependent epimerase/dehydratase family enzyme